MWSLKAKESSDKWMFQELVAEGELGSSIARQRC